MDSPISNYLSQFAGEEIIYIPNPGNAGDSLIAAATYQLLDRLNINYETPRAHRLQPRNRIVIYGGGGNLVAPHTYSARLCRHTHNTAKRLIILPHTIKNVSSLLADFGPNVDIFCREEISYQYVAAHAQRANVFLADDMALGLSIAEVNEPHPGPLGDVSPLFSFMRKKFFTSTGVPSLSNVLRATRRKRIRRELDHFARSRALFCFRTDPEKSGIAVPENNVDLSEVYSFGVTPKAIAYLTTYEVLQFLGRFHTIHTNRLHMAIGGALVGCQVKLYPNNYYKNRAVFQYSLAGRYPNVVWISQEEGSPA